MKLPKTRSLYLACLLAIAAIAPAARTQDAPTAEAFGGYSYLSIDTNDLDGRQSANGWEAGFDANANRYHVAAEFDANGAYKTVLGVNVSDYGYTAGLRVNVRPAFVHALFGADTLSGSYAGQSKSQTDFLTELGGGLQVKIWRSVSFRTSADFALSRHNIFGGPRIDQNNFRAGAGFVFSFGSARDVSARAPASQPIGEEVASGFGIRGYAVSNGVRVTEVRDGSLAKRAGLDVDDVIVAVNGTPVRTVHDLDDAAAQTSSLRISYLAKDAGLVETSITR